MGREVKYRQPIFLNGKFKCWHYWGHYEDGCFIGPIAPHNDNQQWTGLSDKYGVDMYEGDIIEVKLYPQYADRISWKGPPDATGEVFWDMTGFRFVLRNEFDKRYTDLTDVCYKESQIIGNIYETPERLNQYI